MARFDFRPPPLANEPSLDWVLGRAFAPLELELAPGADGPKSFEIARRLGLAPRIGGRLPEARLEQDVGTETARAFRHEYLSVAAREALLAASVGRVLEVARRVGAPLVLLKHAALRARGVVGPGLRRATDVDVLVPVELARSLQAALLRSGFRANGTRAYEHQLPQLLDPEDVLVEVHLHVPGLRLEASAPFVTAGDLIAAGLVDNVADTLVPSAEILAAHAIAHGFLQNAGTPQSHSPWRVIADLADLQAYHPTSLQASARFLAWALDSDDVSALLELSAAAARGTPHAVSAAAHRLLRHGVASQLEPAYAERLRLRSVTRPLSQHARPRAVLQALLIALFPDPAAMDLLHGPGRTGTRRTADRLARPLSLLKRAIATWGSFHT